MLPPLLLVDEPLPSKPEASLPAPPFPSPKSTPSPATDPNPSFEQQKLGHLTSQKKKKEKDYR